MMSSSGVIPAAVIVIVGGPVGVGVGAGAGALSGGVGAEGVDGVAPPEQAETVNAPMNM